MDDSPTMDHSTFYMTKKGEYMYAMCHTSSISKKKYEVFIVSFGYKTVQKPCAKFY